MSEGRERSYVSNLLNAVQSYVPYDYVRKRLTALLAMDSSRVAEALRKLPQIGYSVTDCYFIHYSINPVVRPTANPDGLLEIFRRFFMNYMRSELYGRVKPLTVLNDKFSTVYSYFIIKNFVESYVTVRSRFRYLLHSLANFLLGGFKYGRHSSVRVPYGALVCEALAKAVDKSLRALEIMEGLEEVVGDLVGKEPGSYAKLIDLTGKVMNVSFADEILTMGKEISRAASVCGEGLVRGRYGDEVWGYGYTRNVQRAIHRELALPDDILLTKVSSGRLLYREMMRGPHSTIYVLVDKSGSMSLGAKTVWSRSVALALYRYARGVGVRFYLRFFDVTVYEMISDRDLHRLLDDLIRVESEGGTCIDCAIREAVRDVEVGRVPSSSDVLAVLITDGKDEVRTAVEALKKVGVRLVAVMVEGHNEDLKRLALGSGGRFLKVVPDRSGGLAVIRAVREVGLG